MLALIAAAAAGAARADGDPASDVLVSYNLFLPQDAGAGTAQQLQLTALITAADRRVAPLRVALIASPSDLGSITGLWRQPQEYARFLDSELTLVYRGSLLVVMPDGYGLAGPAAQRPAARHAVAALPPPRRALVAGAVRAIQRLAQAEGRPLALPAVRSPSRAPGSGPIAWIAFAVGLLMVLAAWGASLRARPLRRLA